MSGYDDTKQRALVHLGGRELRLTPTGPARVLAIAVRLEGGRSGTVEA